MKIKNLNKVDFDSPELKKLWNELEKRNEELLASTKVDYVSLNRCFDY